MYAVMYGSWGECFREVDSLEEAERLVSLIEERWEEDAWIVAID